MLIEEKIFRRKRPVLERVLQYGFRKTADGFCYETAFMDGEFRASVFLDRNGKITGKVLDVMNREEYHPLRVETYKGAYVNTVRNAYEDVLREIADACCIDVVFVAEQSNRIATQILQRYGISPDFPFGTSPNEAYGVFRHGDNGKWFALIMNIKCAALAETVKKETGRAPEVLLRQEGAHIDVINLKSVPEDREALYKEKGIFPAYHMNHTHWISVTLDDSLPDDRVMQLVDTGFRLTGKKRR
jgi:predicted DNA-binding protein (MmcQ/YjbR family)